MQPTNASFENRPIPDWYDDCKLGIFVHWGIYSVPAWAPLSGSIWDEREGEPKTPRFEANPYAEWYLNTLRIAESSTARHHSETYGANTPYSSFAETWNREIEAWQPEHWAELFERAGAGYVVLTTKHHDGFLLWPSAHRHPDHRDYVASRDVVGELTQAVRDRGLRMGLYYSGGIDWLFNDQVIEGFGDFLKATSHGPEYIAYATAHWKELIDRYAPCCMWNDIAFPGEVEQIEELFAYYYGRVPDGVVNDRFRMTLGKAGLEPALPHDVRTPEYTTVSEISSKKFESVRGIGNSFGYNQMEGEGEYLSTRELIHNFADLVSKNGNLLINVGPRADGSIPEPQVERLEGLGAWLQVCGEAIRGTRPWRRAAARSRGGEELRFTRKRGTLYAIVLDPRPGAELAFEELGPRSGSQVTLLGAPNPLETRDEGRVVCLPAALPSPHAVALKWETGE